MTFIASTVLLVAVANYWTPFTHAGSLASKLVQSAATVKNKLVANTEDLKPMDVVACGRSSLPVFGYASDEKDAQVDNHPWTALLIHGNGFACPGVLIPTWKANSSFAVATSSWCHRQGMASDIRVVTGISSDGRINGTYSKVSMVAQSFHTPMNHSDSVAFVFFTPEVTFNEHVKPICLPSQGHPPKHSPCVVTGWKVKMAEREPWDHALKRISTARLKETFLVATRMKTFYSDGIQYFRIKDTFKKNGTTHSTGSPLVCRHKGLWTLYGINIPDLSKKRRSTFMDLYNQLYLIKDELQLPLGNDGTFSR